MGAYYDIDFALMYLRLKGAGIFYKVLNTPARIDVIEKMGHLDREMPTSSATRPPSTAHRPRSAVATGHSAGSLPPPGAGGGPHRPGPPLIPENLRSSVSTPASPRSAAGTRAYFNRLFGV